MKKTRVNWQMFPKYKEGMFPYIVRNRMIYSEKNDFDNYMVAKLNFYGGRQQRASILHLDVYLKGSCYTNHYIVINVGKMRI